MTSIENYNSVITTYDKCGLDLFSTKTQVEVVQRFNTDFQITFA